MEAMINSNISTVNCNTNVEQLRDLISQQAANVTDKVRLVMCLKQLLDVNRPFGGLSDDELSKELSQYPDFTESELSTLADIDYKKCRPYQSDKNLKTIAKWL
jgi:hypothetical protein